MAGHASFLCLFMANSRLVVPRRAAADNIFGL
jgi:hypothetical protein